CRATQSVASYHTLASDLETGALFQACPIKRRIARKSCCYVDAFSGTNGAIGPVASPPEIGKGLVEAERAGKKRLVCGLRRKMVGELLPELQIHNRTTNRLEDVLIDDVVAGDGHQGHAELQASPGLGLEPVGEQLFASRLVALDLRVLDVLDRNIDA